MAIPFPDLAVATVDQELAALVLRDLTTLLDRLALGFVNGGRFAVAGPANGPVPPVGHDVLIFARHCVILCFPAEVGIRAPRRRRRPEVRLDLQLVRRRARLRRTSGKKISRHVRGELGGGLTLRGGSDPSKRKRTIV